MEPVKRLSTAVEIAITPADFARLVSFFAVSPSTKSPIVKFRIRLDLMNLIRSLAFCVIGLLLLAIKPRRQAPGGGAAARVCDYFCRSR